MCILINYIYGVWFYLFLIKQNFLNNFKTYFTSQCYMKPGVLIVHIVLINTSADEYSTVWLTVIRCSNTYPWITNSVPSSNSSIRNKYNKRRWLLCSDCFSHFYLQVAKSENQDYNQGTFSIANTFGTLFSSENDKQKIDQYFLCKADIY